MSRFVAIRLLYLLAGLILASALIFFSLRILPGDVAQVIAGTEATPERVQQLREALGLTRPLSEQYLDWVGGFLTFDLGNSLITGTPVWGQILEKLEVTGPLTVFAMLISIAFALPLGLLAASRRSGAGANTLSVGTLTIASVPVMWAGMLLILLFARTLGWFPAQGFPRDGWHDPVAATLSLMLPALTLGLVEGAFFFRFVRSASLEALATDFVRTGMARGLTRNQALRRRALPTVSLSLISLLGLQLAALLVGAVIVEQLFNLPGLGRMLVSDVGNRDLVAVQGTLLLLTGVILCVGTLVDVLHRALDPRLRTVT